MTQGRLVILGFDGLDHALTQRYLDQLPNFRRFGQEGAFGPLQSVFPPDSIPSWITAYTGLDPSCHGVLESINYLAKLGARSRVDTSVFSGRTFWDSVGNAGYPVCVINPFLAYPPWPVNGLMVSGPVFIEGAIKVSGTGRLDRTTIPTSIGGLTDFPTRRTLPAFITATMQETSEQAEFGLTMLRQGEAELFFQTFLTTDRLQHFLWRYCDADDPTWPGPNLFASAILDIYREADQIVGKFQAEMGPEDVLIIISDHGHGMRCTHCCNLNEWLRRKGLVFSLGHGKRFSRKILVERLKNRVLHFMHEHDLEDYISDIARMLPNAKAWKKGEHITNTKQNIAYASDFTGTNPFGGICINPALTADYEQLRFQLITELGALQFDRRPAFHWLRRREELFSGPYITRYPDILFELQPDLGVNWALHTDIFTQNPTHKKISGGHRAAGIYACNRRLDYELKQIADLYPTVLNHFPKCAGGE